MSINFDTFDDKETLLMGDLLHGLDNNFAKVNSSLTGMEASIDNIIQQVQTSELHVYVGSGITVTATQGSLTATAVSGSNGWAVLKLSSYGNWTIKATINGSVKTQIVNIDAVRVYYTSLLSIENMSWNNINLISTSGMAPNAFKAGDTKTVTIGGVTTTLIIIGFDHDIITSSGKKAGITFQLKDCMAQPYPMTNNGDNSKIWTNCLMRAETLPSILASMPSDLKGVIKPVTKLTNDGSANSKVLTSTSDSLFLLSLSEVFSVSEYWDISKLEEGKQYSFYASGNSKIKTRSGAYSAWWLRSPYRVNYSDQYIYFSEVTTIGTSNFATQFTNNGLSFAFCV